ncbi:MAG: phosphate/phosphite/phosphonate ABC transporter substrate-binding protein [Sulfuricurvum sp.]|nr:phosphate/phosphite/phosphonate ABC transporter substrate-binding protein [Sulfuricurvum sp.]
MGCDQIIKSKGTYKPIGVEKEYKNYAFGINAFLDSKEMFIAYRPILNYLENNIEGVKFDLVTSRDFVEHEKRVRKGEFHFALSNPYQSIIGFEHNYGPIAKMKNDTIFRGILIARKDSHIMNFKQLKGKKISFSAPSALAGAIMPKYYLWEHGINVHRDMIPYYVGSHFSAILNTYTKDTYIAATWPRAWNKWKKENPAKAEELEILWETPPLLNNALSVRSDVDPVIAHKVAVLLIGLQNTPEGKKLLEHAGIDGFEYADLKTFEPVRSFMKQYEAALGPVE